MQPYSICSRGYSLFTIWRSRPPEWPPSERLEVFVVVILSFLCRLTALFPLSLQNTEVTHCRIDVTRLVLFLYSQASTGSDKSARRTESQHGISHLIGWNSPNSLSERGPVHDRSLSDSQGIMREGEQSINNPFHHIFHHILDNIAVLIPNIFVVMLLIEFLQEPKKIKNKN